jgi:hypothetical protein
MQRVTNVVVLALLLGATGSAALTFNVDPAKVRVLSLSRACPAPRSASGRALLPPQ